MTVALIASPMAILAKSSGITLDPIAKPIAAVLAFFYALVPNYGIAIILLTISMMVLLTPLTVKQTRSMLVMQKLQPQLKRLQEEHKNDRAALNEAVMALYKEHNASPLGGCLPMLLPLPVFFALFRVLEGLSRKIAGVPKPKYLSPSTKMYHDIVAQGGTLKAFGMDLSKSAASAKGDFLTVLPYFVLLLVMVATQYYQQRQLTSRNPQANQGQQAQIMKFFPLFFGVLSVRFPAGVVLYWTTSNLIRIFQQWAMYRYDPKVKALVEQDVKEVEARTREIDAAKPTSTRLRDYLSRGSAIAKGDPKGGNRPAGGTRKSAGAKPGGTRSTPSGSKPGTPSKGVAKSPPASRTSSPGAKAAPSSGRPGTAANGKPPASPAKAAKTSDGATPPNGKGAKGIPGPGKASGSGRSPAEPAPAATQVPVPPAAAPDALAGSAPAPGATEETNATPNPAAPPGQIGRTGGTGARSAGNRSRRTRRGR
jgi:YidC/Oxa1 family membrane protein insertase